MAKINFHNTKVTAKIGKRIRELRLENELEIEDISAMTGFQYNTIKAIEDGRETDISHFVEIAFALGHHPSEVINVPMTIKPRYKLPATRKEKSRLTARINKIYEDKEFFKTPRITGEVVRELNTRYALATKSAEVSVILLRLAKEGKLKVLKEGRNNRYKM